MVLGKEENMNTQDNIIIYESKEGSVELKVSLDKETVWLSQKQMGDLFGKSLKTINQHIRHIYDEGELEQISTISKSEIVQQEGVRVVSREVNVYNLDVIISVGYRVKSKEGTQFRIWATKVLREHIIKGYTLNQKRLAEKGLRDIEQSLSLIQETLVNQELVTDIGKDALKIVMEYAKSWKLLLAYDENQLNLARSKKQPHQELLYKDALMAISTLKENLIHKGEASPLFGNERDHSLKGILGNIEQTFGGESLYSSIEEKSAHLFYFVIKDHPFTDGNKRIACFLLIAYLTLQGIDFGLNENGIVALALLTAESKPDQKELIVKLITHLIIKESD